jgi:hypothetical protein
MKRYLWLLLALLLPIEAASAIGEQYGRMTGVVYSPDGAEQPGVKLTLTSPALMGPRTIFSSEDGSFTFNSLPPGKYDLLAENQGMRTITQTGISVYVGKTVSMYLAMEVATGENGVLLNQNTHNLPSKSVYRKGCAREYRLLRRWALISQQPVPTKMSISFYLANHLPVGIP